LAAHVKNSPAAICNSAALKVSANVDGVPTNVAATLVNAIWFPFPWKDLFNIDCEIESGALCKPLMCFYSSRYCDKPILSVCTPTAVSQCMCSRNHDAEDHCRKRLEKEDANR